MILKRTIVSALVAAVLAVAACGDDEPDPGTLGGPCKDQKVCDAGLSCLVNSCIADGSLESGRTCAENRQCQSGACLTNPFVCQ